MASKHVLMKTYSDILHEYGNHKIPYSTLLETKEWRDKSNQITKREYNVCQHCFKHCVDGYGLLSPVVYQSFEIEDPIYDPDTGELLGIYAKEAITHVVQTDPHFAHVHHTYYILSRLAWEYSNEDLILLCHKCHTHLHQTQIVTVYRTEAKLETVNLTPCGKCGGTGHLPKHNHVQNGICFRCGGAGFEELI